MSRLGIAVVAWLGSTNVLVGSDDQRDFFEKHVRPILVERCYECHNAEEASGKLRLDTKAGWIRGGESGPAIVPGDPEASLLVRAVSYTDAKLKMPPEKGNRLSAKQVAILRTWIRRGAFDPRDGSGVETDIETAGKTHWAFQPLTRSTIPDGTHPVDYFIDRELRTRGFITTEAADARTLNRRAVYDLHGLPPTRDQLAIPADQFPRLIESLLASPRYGERWGRHWLDVARYSDAKDGVLMYGDARIRPFAYTYRDYVIRAFNTDKPFDDFIRQQLAADQLGLPEHSPDLAAMGFLTLGRMFDSNPHDVIDDRIDVVTRGFLGLTASCARCHDHKFDPIPTADYYSLYGVFASSLEPYERPRIANVSEEGMTYEKEIAAKLAEVRSQEQTHYEQTLETARNRTADYLVQVATTEPDLSETAIFFLSLLPEQLRPQMTYRWRKLIAKRAHPDDQVFAPWYDMMIEPELRVDRWKRVGVDARIIEGLVAAQPKSAEEIARTYGEIIRGEWARGKDLEQKIQTIDSELRALRGGPISVADIVAGGNGFGTGTKGHGIHPGTGELTTGEVGGIDIANHDRLIPVPKNEFVDGVFVPRSGTVVATSTGVKLTDVKPSSGATWDYIRFGPSSGFTVNTIDGVDYNAAPRTMLALHSNKGITFDLAAFRRVHEFSEARFQSVFGHGGAKGESHLDGRIYVDGRLVADFPNFPAQGPGRKIDIELPSTARFLTLVVTEGTQGISHDQAIFGDPQIVPTKTTPSAARQRKITELKSQRDKAVQQLANLEENDDDPLVELLTSRDSPVWFPRSQIYLYLSRQQKDAFRGLVNQLDGISVKHKQAAARAMVMVDSESLYDPVIFQRGDPTLRGTPVPRQFLAVASAGRRLPFPRGSGRLDLADAIASDDNPLTARVWVNRVWMHHFGEPLVANPSDFGLRTTRPVHHELLDELASRFIKGGWKTKPLHRLIMTSDAYRRASEIPTTEVMAKQLSADPQNSLVWHANRRRLDLEQMRDTMLALAGQMDDTMYGRPGSIDDLANKRRTIYAFVERQNIPNIVQTFDFANADTSTARRVTTTVPQQALFLLNSPFMVETAKSVTARVTEGPTAQRVGELYRLVLGRDPTTREVELAGTFVATHPWEQLTQILLMTNELMFVD